MPGAAGCGGGAHRIRLLLSLPATLLPRLASSMEGGFELLPLLLLLRLARTAAGSQSEAPTPKLPTLRLPLLRSALLATRRLLLRFTLLWTMNPPRSSEGQRIKLSPRDGWPHTRRQENDRNTHSTHADTQGNRTHKHGTQVQVV